MALILLDNLKMNQKNKFKVSIIIPAFNEERSIGRVVDELNASHPDYEIIVVNDGSSDQTAAIAKTKPCRVLTHIVNRGYGASWKTGVRAANGEIVVFYDGDGQFNVPDFTRVVQTFISEGADLVSGRRESDSHAPIARRPGKLVLAKLANYLANRKIPDINCGLRAYRRDVLLTYLPLLPDGYSASLTSLLLFYRRNYNVQFVPIKVGKAESKSSVRQLRDGFGTILLMLRLIALFEPLRIFLPASLFLMLISFVYSLVEAFTYGLGVPVLGAVIFMAGFLLFFMGIVCDQISALRLERFRVPEFDHNVLEG